MKITEKKSIEHLIKQIEVWTITKYQHTNAGRFDEADKCHFWLLDCKFQLLDRFDINLFPKGENLERLRESLKNFNSIVYREVL